MFKKVKNIIVNKTLVNGALFSIFSFVNKGLVFLLLLVLARYISPAEYGYLNLFSTVVMLASFFVAMSSEGYFTVAYFREGIHGVRDSFTGILLLSLVFCVFFAIVLFFWGEELSNIAELPIRVLWIVIPISFFTIFTNLSLDYYRIQERIKIYAALSCGNAVLNFVLSIFLVAVLLQGWEGRVYAQLLCYSLFGLIGLSVFVKNRYITKPNTDYIKKLLIYGIPLIPHNAVAFIRQGLDRYIINDCYSIDEVGLFSFALNLANIIMTLGLGFNQSNSVDIYKVLGNSGMTAIEKLQTLKKNRQQLFCVFFFSTILIVAVCIIFIPILLPNYSGSLPYFPILAFYSFLFCMYLLYTNYLFFYRKTQLIMLVTFSSSIIHLVLSLCLTRYSLFWTASIYCISQAIIVIAIQYLAKRELLNSLRETSDYEK